MASIMNETKRTITKSYLKITLFVIDGDYITTNYNKTSIINNTILFVFGALYRQ
jgi:hypothetical protein